MEFKSAAYDEKKKEKEKTLSSLIKKPKLSKLTADIPDSVHQELKKMSLDKRKNIKELVTEALCTFLKCDNPNIKRRKHTVAPTEKDNSAKN